LDFTDRAQDSRGSESSLKLSGSDALSLEDSQLKLAEDSSTLGATLDSSIDLDMDEDLVPGSGAGSDVTLGASDSGINLANPADSGISLEDLSADMGSAIGSGIESLELSDDDMVELEAADSAKAGGSGTGADDDFLLTPVEDGSEADEESDDSGSQVIALDADEFEASAAHAEEGPLIEEDPDFAAAEAAAIITTPVSPTPSVGTVTAQEGAYSIWNIVSLSMIVLVLGFVGILMLDLIRNIWSWQGTFGLNSPIMDAILGMLPG
jgi:hypothetical protein